MKTNTDRSDRERGWATDWGNLLALALIVLVGVYLLWLVFDWGSDQTSLYVRELAFLPVMAAGVLFSARMALRAPVAWETRRAWLLIGAGFAFWFIGDSIWAYYEVFRDEVPYPSLADWAYLLGVPAIFAGILTFPATVTFTRSARVRFWLDAGIILVGISAMVTYLILGPEVLSIDDWSVETFLFLPYPFTDVLLIVGVFAILVRRPEVGSLSALVMFAAGLLTIAASDLIWTFQEAREVYIAGGVTYALWMVGQALVVLTPQRHYDTINRDLEQFTPSFYADLARDYVPYASALVAMIVLVVAGLPGLAAELGMTVGFLFILALLVVARQFYTLRENAQFRLTQAVVKSEERFQALVEHSSDVITVLEGDLMCRYQSPSSQKIIGQSPAEFVGRYFLDWVHQDDRELVQQALLEAVNDPSISATLEWQVYGTDGSTIHLETVISNELENPSVRGLVLNSRDVTDRKKLESDLTYQAYHDALTGLPNRSMFLNNLVRAVASEGAKNGIGVLFVDLDRFKTVNDTLGHDAGDELLFKVGQRLTQALRPGDTLGRLAGDEFTILLNGLRDADEARRIAERLHKRLQEPLWIASTELQISSSIGVAFTDSVSVSPEDLLRQADSAMYVAKRNGRGRVEIFDPSMASQMEHLSRDRTLMGSADS